MQTILKKFNFLKTFVSDFHVGAISASSKFVISKVLTNVPKKLDIVIEYGPGEGAMTKEILKNLSKNGRIIVIEPNKEFLRHLHFLDKRIEIIEGLAQDIMGSSAYNLPKADVIISSLPFSFLNKVERNKIIQLSYLNLKNGGKIIVFHQYQLVAYSYVQKYFKNSKISFEYRNIFPCFIFVGEK